MATLVRGWVNIIDICLDLHGIFSILNRMVSHFILSVKAMFTLLCLTFFEGSSSAGSSSDASSSDELSMPWLCCSKSKDCKVLLINYSPSC
jgi:hypothetical protein